MMKNINLIIKKNEVKFRLDVLINKRVEKLSRTRIKNLILGGNVKLNDKVLTDPSKKVNEEDNVKILIPTPKKLSLKPYKFKLDIIFEDKDLMVINKPAGIAMHPAPGNYDNTIVNALISYDKNSLSTIGDELRPGIVHRIDKDTSGLIVIAKNNKSHENLSNQFNKHSIKRVYQLLIWGKIRPSKGRIETLITRISNNRQMIEVSSYKG